MANSVDPDQTAPIGTACSGSPLFASILNSSVIFGNYLQQTTSADDISDEFFSFNNSYTCKTLRKLIINSILSNDFVRHTCYLCHCMSFS